MTTLKQIMNLVDAYGSERCSGNEYDNRYAEKRARDAVVSALKEYAPQHMIDYPDEGAVFLCPAGQSEQKPVVCQKCKGLGYYDEGHECDDGTMVGGNYVECEKCKQP